MVLPLELGIVFSLEPFVVLVDDFSLFEVASFCEVDFNSCAFVFLEGEVIGAVKKVKLNLYTNQHILLTRPTPPPHPSSL